jgi:8-oxo-dGTP diphosphatase
MMRRESFDEGVRVLASVAILRGNSLLLINEREEPYNGQWVLPQGYPRLGETVSDAAKREVREELGVEVDLDGLVGVYDDLVREGSRLTHHVIIVYIGRIKEGTGEPRPTTEAIDSAWVDIRRGLPEVPEVMKRIVHDLARVRKRRIRIGW